MENDKEPRTMDAAKAKTITGTEIEEEGTDECLSRTPEQELNDYYDAMMDGPVPPLPIRR